jgi:hypothetical protein
MVYTLDFNIEEQLYPELLELEEIGVLPPSSEFVRECPTKFCLHDFVLIENKLLHCSNDVNESSLFHDEIPCCNILQLV